MRKVYIEGSRISLTEFLNEDYLPFYETWLDPVTRKNFNAAGEFDSAEECLKFFTDPARPPQRMNAAIRSDKKTIGRISLAPAGEEPDLGIWVFSEHRGQGVGSEAVSLAVRYIFASTDLQYLIAGIFSFNLASRKIFEKLGFRRATELDETQESIVGEGEVTELGYRLERS